MDLFPTEKEMRQLSRSLNPLAQIMDVLYSRPPAEGSMAEFFLDSEDIDLVMEDDAMPYLEYNRDIDTIRYRGSSFEVVCEKPDFLNDPIVQHASSWDEI